jgi:hypothetical protein
VRVVARLGVASSEPPCIIGLVILIPLVGGALAGGGDDASKPAPVETIGEIPLTPAEQLHKDYGGTLAVYEELTSSDDCARRQKSFDRAAANNDRDEPLTTEHGWTLGYMNAADDRMRAIGCFDCGSSSVALEGGGIS